MRIYNRTNRQHVRYFLRLLRTDLTPIDYWTLAMGLALLFFVIRWPAAANAQIDPCDVCQAEHGVAACPCLPVQAEPTPLPVPPPLPGGTIPPVAGIACDDKVFMPVMLVGDVTGEGGSGILPVRGQP